MRTILLNESKSVVLNGSGDGLVEIAQRPSERWHVKTVAITVSPRTVVPQGLLFMGDSPSQMNQVDATLFGANNVSDALDGVEIPDGAKIFVQWIGGNPGATATMNVRGTKDVP